MLAKLFILLFLCFNSYALTLKNITTAIKSEESSTDQVLLLATEPKEAKVSFAKGIFTAEFKNKKITGTYQALQDGAGLIYLVGLGKTSEGEQRFFNSVYTAMKVNSNGKGIYQYKTIISGENQDIVVISGKTEIKPTA